jgi:hypothetical protein
MVSLEVIYKTGYFKIEKNPQFNYSELDFFIMEKYWKAFWEKLVFENPILRIAFFR